MAFPKLKNKHLEEAIFNPASSLDLGNIPKNLPKRFVLIYSKDQLDYLEREYEPSPVEGVSKGLYELYSHCEIGIVKINGIGSPHAAAVLDDLIFLGGEVFINVGCAGGLSKSGVFLCRRALRDEGTSYHYLPPRDYSYPDKELTHFLGNSLKKQALKFKIGSNWTIDAPYRETMKEIECYRKKGILTVDMEVSALFAVAEFRKVRIAAAFAVSDVLGNGRRDLTNPGDYAKNLNGITDAAIDCLKSGTF